MSTIFRAQLRSRRVRQKLDSWPCQQLDSWPWHNQRRHIRQHPVVVLKNATLYKTYPSPAADADGSNAPVLSDVSFSLPSTKQYWAVVSPSSVARTNFLKALNGNFICLPPAARSYPHFKSLKVIPDQVIKYVGFDAERGGLGGTALQGAYLSARYEAHREVTDWSLLNYLEGNTELNALEKSEDAVDHDLLDKIIADLNLRSLLDMPVSNLSNGQTRRARIAKALLTKPQLLLLDGPFMGLDPLTQRSISLLLKDMASARKPRLVLSLRPDEVIPDWITHLVCLDSQLNVIDQGSKEDVVKSVRQNKQHMEAFNRFRSVDRHLKLPKISRDALPAEHDRIPPGDPIVEMQGVEVAYGDRQDSTRRVVLGDWSEPSPEDNQETRKGLWWTVRRGERWGIFGPNGSGKTTLLSLITSDHPQTYGLPIKLFGRSRLPEPGQPGISIFELQSRMGHSSPEVHTYFPKHLSVRRVLESAWADAPLTKPRLTHQDDVKVDAFLRWFAPELSPTGDGVLRQLAEDPKLAKPKLERLKINGSDLDWADSVTFRDLSFSSQRVVLFLRALVASPDLVILDEAFSGMDSDVRNKCLLFLSHGESKEISHAKPPRHIRKGLMAIHDMVTFKGLEERQALLTISHSKEDVPGCVRQWIRLPEPGEGHPPTVGDLPGPLDCTRAGWDSIWGE